MIYLASPYSGTPEQMQHRYNITLAYTAEAIRQGNKIFSPIVYGHHMADIVGTSAAAWKEINDVMIARATDLWVLTIDGWQDSKGVKQEIALYRYWHQKEPKFVQVFE